MHGPAQEPLGLQVVGVAQLIGTALDAALTAAGGSLGTWMVLVSAIPEAHQPRIGLSQTLGMPVSTPAEDVDDLERPGLLIRKSGAESAGRGLIELTAAGEALLRGLLRAVVAFDARLGAGMSDEEISDLVSSVAKLRRNLDHQDT